MIVYPVYPTYRYLYRPVVEGGLVGGYAERPRLRPHVLLLLGPAPPGPDRAGARARLRHVAVEALAQRGVERRCHPGVLGQHVVLDGHDVHDREEARAV